MFEHNAMELVMYYIDLSKNRDVRLAFEALKVFYFFGMSTCIHEDVVTLVHQ